MREFPQKNHCVDVLCLFAINLKMNINFVMDSSFYLTFDFCPLINEFEKRKCIPLRVEIVFFFFCNEKSAHLSLTTRTNGKNSNIIH